MLLCVHLFYRTIENGVSQQNFHRDSLQEMESELAIIREQNDKYSREIRQYEKDYYDTEKQQILDNFEMKLSEVREINEREIYSRARNDLISENQKMRDNYEIKLDTVQSKYKQIQEKLSEQTTENLRLKEINKNWQIEQGDMVKKYETKLQGKFHIKYLDIKLCCS